MKLFLLINIFLIISSINEINSLNCASNKIKINSGVLHIPNYKSRRRMDNKDDNKNYTNIKIGVDYTNFKETNLTNQSNCNKIKELINETITDFQKLIKIEHRKINLTNIKNSNITIKSRCNLETLNENYGDFLIDNDVIIFVSVKNDLDDILVSGSNCLFTFDYRIIGGVLYINNNINFTKKNSDLYFKYCLLHELTHILIFDPNILKGLEMITKKKNKYYVNSKTVLEKARMHFNCKSLMGVQLEDIEEGGEKIAGYHWDPRYMLGDYMISFDYMDVVISDITLALFEDSGFYEVNYYTGGLFKFGKNKGCDFINLNITNSSLFNDYFCFVPGISQCSQSRASTGHCTIYNYSKEIDEKGYQIFNNHYIGGLKRMNYAPIPEVGAIGENDLDYFPQSCYSIKDEENKINWEARGNKSFCFMNSLTNNSSDVSNKMEAMCYQVECNINKTLSIYVNGNIINCHNETKNVQQGIYGSIECPKYNDICNADNTTCNEIFNCINYKISVDYNSYDYNFNQSTFIYNKFKFLFLMTLIILFLN